MQRVVFTKKDMVVVPVQLSEVELLKETVDQLRAQLDAYQRWFTTHEQWVKQHNIDTQYDPMIAPIPGAEKTWYVSDVVHSDSPPA